ncbi:hypothetical protein I7I48_00770 [Histoplasma ohiense]|nr:hypothetical protein I7I48_00770 [Histoplasma ohiense (nom. inval.)]
MIRSTSGDIELDVYTILRPKPGEFCSLSSGSVANNVMKSLQGARLESPVGRIHNLWLFSETTGYPSNVI